MVQGIPKVCLGAFHIMAFLRGRKDVHGLPIRNLIMLLACVAMPPIPGTFSLLYLGTVPGWLVVESAFVLLFSMGALICYLSAGAYLQKRRLFKQ